MRIIKYQNLSKYQYNKFENFLKESSKEIDQPAHENMWNIDWQNKSNTLPYILSNTDRFFNQGIFHILFNDNDVVACSGAYTSEFSKDIAILGTRTWVKKEYRNKLIIRDYMLPAEKKWAIKNKFKIILITFNSYNKNLVELWKRKRLGDNRTPIKPYNFGFNPEFLNFSVKIQHTEQWIVYEKIDPLFNFSWETIKYQN